MVNPTTENRPIPKEELITPEDIEVTKDAANEEVRQQKGREDDVEKNMGMEVEESSKTIDTDTGTANSVLCSSPWYFCQESVGFKESACLA